MPAKKAEALIIGFDDDREPFANKPNLKNRVEKSSKFVPKSQINLPSFEKV